MAVGNTGFWLVRYLCIMTAKLYNWLLVDYLHMGAVLI